MKITLIAVGTKMPAWVNEGVKEYSKRLPPELKFEIKEIPLGRRSKNTDLKRAIDTEGALMQNAIGRGDHIVALEVTGKAWSTETLAGELQAWQLNGHNISLLIGGPDGLSKECLALAHQKWSLSALTLPHPLVRIMIVEQLYRAWTINNNHPYHRS